MATLTPSLRTLKKSIEGDTRTLCGRDYIVIPVVALVEGVRHAGGSPAPELVLAEAFGRHVDTWNGRPIVVNHPTNSDGYSVLASSPDVLESCYLGELMNAKVQNGKLIVEAWLDVAAITLSKSTIVQDMWQRLLEGKVVEVSVGAIVYTKAEKGKHSGKQYSGKWDIVIPDHLAFLDENQIGACSVEDGCGTFRTQNAGGVQLSEGLRMANKNSVSVKTIRATEKTDCGCHSEGEPSDAPCTCDNSEDGEQQNLESSLTRALFNKDTFEVDRRALLQKAVKAKFGYAYVLSYNDELVVFEQYDNKADNYKTFKVSYKSDSNNKITLGADPPEEVMFQLKVVNLNSDRGKPMAGKKTASKQSVDDMEDDDANTEVDESETVENTPVKKKLKGTQKMASSNQIDLNDIETLDALNKALEGTPLGKALSASLKVAGLVRANAIAQIKKLTKGKVYTDDILNGMDFAALDATATMLSVQAAGADAEVVESEEEKKEEETTMGLGYMSYDQKVRLKKPEAPVVPKKAPANPTNFAGRAGGAASKNGIPPPPDVFDIDDATNLIRTKN